MRSRIGIALVGLILPASPSLAQQASSPSLDEASKQSENPVTRWITVPLRYQADFQEGPYGATKDTYQLSQAILPFKLNDDWALITRTKLPFETVPPSKLGGSWASGLSNGYTTFFLSPQHGNGFYWGAGPLLYYPSANNPSLGVNKFGSGPSVAFDVQGDGPWQFGAVVNNIWSFGGSGQGDNRTNQLLLNPFVSYNFADGWSIVTSPQITANWVASGEKWTLPVGGGVTKVVEISGRPVKFGLTSYYNAVRPKAASDTWLLQFTVTWLFPT